MQKFTPKFLDVAGSDDSPKPPQFGVWLRRCREGLGITRSAFAEVANVSDADLRAIECRRRLPTAEQRTRLIQTVARHDTKLASTVPAED